MDEFEKLVDASTLYLNALSQREKFLWPASSMDLVKQASTSLSEDESQELAREFWSAQELVRDLAEALVKDFHTLSISDDEFEDVLDPNHTIPEAAGRAEAYLAGTEFADAKAEPLTTATAALMYSGVVFILACAYRVATSRASEGGLEVTVPLASLSMQFSAKSRKAAEKIEKNVAAEKDK